VLLSLASLGIGFAISAVSRTELQAMQLAMLVLLASVFFSGFFVPISAFLPPALGIAYSLPVTHAVSALQSLMLRGQAPPLVPVCALAVLVVIPYLMASLVFRRQLRLD
jgi:ABC-2 type transport system permease protein